MNWIKQLFCNHNWYRKREHMIHAGMGKMFVNKCAICEKEKAEFV